jgi:hypothetical protein
MSECVCLCGYPFVPLRYGKFLLGFGLNREM